LSTTTLIVVAPYDNETGGRNDTITTSVAAALSAAVHPPLAAVSCSEITNAVIRRRSRSELLGSAIPESNVRTSIFVLKPTLTSFQKNTVYEFIATYGQLRDYQDLFSSGFHNDFNNIV